MTSLADRSDDMGELKENEESNTIRETLSGSNAEKWRTSMDSELHRQWKRTIDDVALSSGNKPIKTTIVFNLERLRMVESNDTSRDKHRFHPTHGDRRPETFSPVVGVDIVRTVAAVSAMRGWKMRKLDMKQADLNAKLSKDIWLELTDEAVKSCNAIEGLK